MKKLVFSKEKFIEIEGVEEYVESKDWVDGCDGKTTRECYPYAILDVWMVEVDDESKEETLVSDETIDEVLPRIHHYQPKHALMGENVDVVTIDEHCEKHSEIHHPSHYTLHKHECIEEMIAVFGIEDVKTFCKLNVWKYRYRSSGKGGEKDLHKADEYMDILIELQGETNED